MKLIKLTDEHYVIVDDSEIKEGDWCLMFDDYGNLFLGNQPQQYLGEHAGHHLNKGLKKITYSTQPLEYSSKIGKYWSKVMPLTLTIPEIKELIGEVDVEQYAWDNPVLSRKDVYELFNDVFKDRRIEGAYQLSESKQVHQFNARLRELAKQKALENNREKRYVEVEKKAHRMFSSSYIVMEGLDIAPAHRQGYVEGYNQALEDNKDKKYTENQAKQIWKAGQEYWKTSGASITFEELTERMINQPKTEWEVEFVNGKLKLK